jgi:hypothetical protein
MKDFKKMPKMACGGGVGKYEDGGEVKLSAVDKLKNKLSSVNDSSLNTLKDKLADRSQRTQEVFNTHDHFTNNTTKGSMNTSGRSGVNSGAGGTASDNKMLLNPRAMKSGGKVKRGNKK